MADRLYTQQSIAGKAADSIQYAWSDPEQRFEWLQLQTRRRAFRNLATMPGELYSWSITSGAKGGQKPLFPDLGKSYENPGKFIDSSLFSGLVFKNALDIVAKFGLSTFVKTATVGYHRHENYHRLLAASDEMLALAHAAPLVDPQTAQIVADIAKTQGTALEQMATHSAEAGRVLAGFAQGSLPVTAENMRLLHTSLRGLSTLSDQKVGLPPALPHRQPLQTPAAPLYYVVNSSAVQSPYEASLYLTLLSGLVTDGAVEISSEIYHPKDEHYLSAKESLHIARTVEAALNRQHLRVNRDDNGQPLRPDLPFGVMLEQRGDGWQPASATSIVDVVNEVKQKLAPLQDRISVMLDYADKHFQDINRQMTEGQTNTEQQDSLQQRRANWSSTHTSALTPPPTERGKAGAYYRTSELGLDYIIRGQSRHEMWKLYGRSLPAYLYQAPINIIERLLLPNKKTGQWTFDPSVIKGEFKAAGWMTFYNPIAESFAGVGSYEAMRLGRATTVNQSRYMDHFLAAAVESTRANDTDFGDALEALHHSDRITAIHKQYASVLAKPVDQRNDDDYRAISAYFTDLSEAVQSIAEPVYAMLTPEGGGFDGFKQHVQNVLLHDPKSQTDALTVFTLLRFVQSIANEQILSMEYVAPEDTITDNKTLRRMTDYMAERLSAHGFVINGTTVTDHGERIAVHCSDATPGALVKRLPDNSFQPVSPQEMIDFASEMTRFMRSRSGIDLAKLFDITEGRLSDQYMHHLEQDLLKDATLPELPTLGDNVAAGDGDQPVAQAELASKLRHQRRHHHYWQELKDHVTRPEAVDEMNKLRDRTFFVALFGIPVKMISNTLRGDFSNISGMFGKWSLVSTAFHATASTLSASYGAVAMREITSLPGYWLKEDATDASQALQGAIGTLGTHHPEMKQRFAAKTGVNPLLGNKRVSEDLYWSARFETPGRSGKELVDTTLSAFTGTPEKSQPDLLYLLSRKAETSEQAVELLATVDALIRMQSASVNVLSYDGVSQQVMSDKALRKLVDHINDRIYTEGLHVNIDIKGLPQLIDDDGKLAPEGTLVSLANEAAAYASTTLEAHAKKTGGFAQQVMESKLKASERDAIINAL